MRQDAQKLNAIATNPWFLVISGVSSIAAFMWFVYDKYAATPGLISTIAFFGARES